MHASPPCSLLNLPSELLLDIFNIIGVQFFRENLGRLTLSKHWWEFARTILLKHGYISDNTLPCFFRALRIGVYLREKMRALTLDLHPQGYSLRSKPANTRFESCTRKPTFPMILRHRANSQLQSYPTMVNFRLETLAAKLQTFQNLHTLYLTAWPQSHSNITQNHSQNYISSHAIVALLEIPSLTHLHLDIGGSELLPEYPNPHPHLCTYIAALLPRLRSLVLRLQTICPCALQLPPETSSTTPIRLESLLVSLCIGTWQDMRHWPVKPAFPCPSRHRKHHDGGVRWLQREMERSAVVLVGRMARPRKVGVLHYRFPCMRREAFDAVRGRRVLLNDADMAWDGEGEGQEMLKRGNKVKVEEDFDHDTGSHSISGSDSESDDDSSDQEDGDI